jgi:F-type H+-transporting ATPase subunit epsilon
VRTFLLEILTPRGEAVRREVSFVEAPGEEGRLGVLAGHVPAVVALVAGRFDFRRADGAREQWQLGRGVMTLTGDAVAVLVQSAAEGAAA